MNQEICLTNEDVIRFCERLKGMEDKITILCAQNDEIKSTLEKQRTDFATYRSDMGDVVSRMSGKLENQIESVEKNICAKIGEVPDGETVMSCFRATDQKVAKIYWFASIVPAIWVSALWLLENLSKVYLFLSSK